jgi:hypothetical protein
MAVGAAALSSRSTSLGRRSHVGRVSREVGQLLALGVTALSSRCTIPWRMSATDLRMSLPGAADTHLDDSGVISVAQDRCRPLGPGRDRRFGAFRR